MSEQNTVTLTPDESAFIINLLKQVQVPALQADGAEVCRLSLAITQKCETIIRTSLPLASAAQTTKTEDDTAPVLEIADPTQNGNQSKSPDTLDLAKAAANA